MIAATKATKENMGFYIQILSLVIVGIVLLWFGYTIFLGPISPFYPGLFPWRNWGKREKTIGEPGDPQVCPVCSLRMERGELVKSVAFPSLNGGMDRLLYIKGCFSCLESKLQPAGLFKREIDVPRRCPVCGQILSLDDFLVSRMFERVGRNNHVHVIGCNICKRI